MTQVPVSRYAWFALVAGVGAIVDLASKHWAFAHVGIPGSPTWWIWDEHVGLQTSLNQGALFGFGQGMVWLFAVLSILAAVFIVYWLFVAGAARDRLLTFALALVMGGVLGNLYDRLGLWSLPGRPELRLHAVRDWILLQYDNQHRWPNFNIADSMLVCGAALLAWHAWRVGPAPSSNPSRTDTDAAGAGGG